MHDHYLTKSDFRVAQSCPTKLYYRKLGYPTREDGDEYLGALVEQGYLIEALARALYPDGRWIGYRDDVESAVWDTMTALAADSTTLFEATFINAGRMARADILVKQGQRLELIEIKSRGFDRRRHDELIAAGRPNLFHAPRATDGLDGKWRPVIEDAAFQVSILQDIFPGLEIVPYLLMPDVSRPCSVDGLHRHFALRSLAPEQTGARDLAADFTGDARELRRDLFLTRVAIADEVARVLPVVRHQADLFASHLMPQLRAAPPVLATRCRDCEYRVDGDRQSGFHECWGDMAGAIPHILDLYRVSDLGGPGAPLFAELVGAGKASLLDIPERRLGKRDGSQGEHSTRQRRQLAAARQNHEWRSDELADILRALPYPLAFVDFETCRPAVPRYRGMRPFEVVAFQWCCQTVAAPGASPQHSEWLQTTDAFPNITFVGSLRRQLGDSGAVLVWSSHEANVLRAIQRQMVERDETDSEIYGWLERLLAGDRLVDMCQLARRHYLHPRTAGSSSLKRIAEAVWGSDESIRRRMPQYLPSSGEIGTPYATLPSLQIGDRTIAIAEGTGAIVAYYTMMERAAAAATLEAEGWRRLLRQYCKLDTLAMVMIWWRWRALCGLGD